MNLNEKIEDRRKALALDFGYLQQLQLDASARGGVTSVSAPNIEALLKSIAATYSLIVELQAVDSADPTAAIAARVKERQEQAAKNLREQKEKAESNLSSVAPIVAPLRPSEASGNAQ